MKNTELRIAIIVLLLVGISGPAQAITEYLILQDIGAYDHKTQSRDFITGQPRNIPGYSTRTAPGFLAGADHFDLDHDDKTYETKYINRSIGLGVEVQVTQHSGDDSDRWLLHEAERGFRDTDNMEASPDEDSMIRVLNNNKIFFYGGGIVGYRWISNNVVVNIQYTNLSGPKPEPLEVVNAYLTKFPSTISLAEDEFKARAHNEQWIKDEMDRRLWLCDKWFMQLQLKKAEEKDVYREAVKSMNVFLDYREKYYGIKAEDEKNFLAGYLAQNNGTGIKSKLAEYKNWWGVNKGKAINL
jgi:hypothetical protein